jgi:hypothetical protein
MTITILASIGTVAAGIVGGFASLLSWVRERWSIRQNDEACVGVIESRIGPEQAALLLTGREDRGVKQTKALTALIKSLSDTEKAAIRLGDVLLIKDAGTVTVRHLSPRELRYLDRHPELSTKPSELLDSLKDPGNPLGRGSISRLSI